MSSTIIYHQLAVRFPKTFTGLDDDLYAIVAQMGSSNCFEMGSGRGGCGRRSRDWQALALGTASAVMRQSIEAAGSCEGGMLKVRHANGDVRPEQFITTARNLMKRADENDITLGPIRFKEGYVSVWFMEPDTKTLASRDARKVYLSDQPAVREWLRSTAFAEHLQKLQPYSLLGVSGPEIRG